VTMRQVIEQLCSVVEADLADQFGKSESHEASMERLRRAESPSELISVAQQLGTAGRW
jgi:hypothetical protein